jgi:serine/threonine-protein kinase
VPWLPSSVAELVTRFTSRDPAQRPADGGEALAAVRAVRAAVTAAEPEVLARRADPPAGFIPPTPHPVADSDVASTSDSLDAGALDEIPVVGPVSPVTGSSSVEGWFPPEGSDQSTERLVDQPTTRVTSAPEGRSTAVAATVRPRRRWPRVVAWVLTLAVVLGGGGFGAWWWFEDGPGAWTTVPAGLTEAPLDKATEILASHGLESTTTQTHDDEAPEGSVLSATPGEGEQIRKDGTVELVVSLGVRMVTVPEGLVGLAEDEAEAALTAADLAVGPADQEWSDTVPVGTVMEVSHAANSSVPHSTVVTLTVSGGPAPVTVTQQVGRERDDARAALEELGLKVEFTEDEPSETVLAGRVIRQSPESGTPAHRLDTVSLTVSSGPPIVEVPNVTGQTTATARETLEAAGFHVRVTTQWGGVLGLVRFQDTTGTAPKGSTITITVV